MVICLAVVCPSEDMFRDSFGLGAGSYVAFHLLVLGLLTWITGQRFLLPSLGPSIFVLATLPDHDLHVPRRFVVGQLIGALAAFVATQILLGDISAVGQIQPLSLVGLHQVAASFTAALLTTIGMYVTNSQHPPAYATTLIISLGLITTLGAIVSFALAVFVTIGLHELLANRIRVWDLPYQYEK